MTEVSQRPPQEPLVPPGGIDAHLRDMTATFSADVTLDAAQRKLAEANQWLPIDGPADATLGALVETNSTGPLRLGYGAWRDLLLGCQFQSGRGELITAGGKTVKNVAGYDLTKFMVGQRGIFGALVTLTTRTYRLPEQALLARFEPDPAILRRLLPGPCRPQWSILTSDALYFGYLGDERTIGYYESNLPRHHSAELTRRSLDEDIAHRAALWSDRNPPPSQGGTGGGLAADNPRNPPPSQGGAGGGWTAEPPRNPPPSQGGTGGGWSANQPAPAEPAARAPDQSAPQPDPQKPAATPAIRFRIAIPPARVLELIHQSDLANWVADPAFGVIIGRCDPDARTALADAAHRLSGSATFFNLEGALLDVSTNPAQRAMIEKLKHAFDPEGRLAPLPWQDS